MNKDLVSLINCCVTQTIEMNTNVHWVFKFVLFRAVTLHLSLQVGHGLLEGLWWRPLVVTENCNRTVRSVIGQQLLCLVI